MTDLHNLNNMQMTLVTVKVRGAQSADTDFTGGIRYLRAAFRFFFSLRKFMWVTHLSTLNDQFTDAAHEHVFSLTVFLIAAQREIKQRHYGQQLYTYNVVHVTRHLCFSGSTI